VDKSNEGDSRILPTLPEWTAPKTSEVFNIEDFYLAVVDQQDTLLKGLTFSSEAEKGESMTLLALVTVFQFAENLADRPMCAALTRRTDWRHALRLPHQSASFDPGWLCSFRQLLVGHSNRLQEFQCLLDRCTAAGLLGRGKRDTQAGEVVEFVCRLNQLERMHEALSQAIGALACHQPDTLRSLAQPHWYHRYQGRGARELESICAGDQEVCAVALGSDARHLIEAIARAGKPELSALPEVVHLSTILKLQYQLQGTTLTWRRTSCKLCPWLAEGISTFRSGNQEPEFARRRSDHED